MGAPLSSIARRIIEGRGAAGNIAKSFAARFAAPATTDPLPQFSPQPYQSMHARTHATKTIAAERNAGIMVNSKKTLPREFTEEDKLTLNTLLVSFAWKWHRSRLQELTQKAKDPKAYLNTIEQYLKTQGEHYPRTQDESDSEYSDRVLVGELRRGNPGIVADAMYSILVIKPVLHVLSPQKKGEPPEKWINRVYLMAALNNDFPDAYPRAMLAREFITSAERAATQGLGPINTAADTLDKMLTRVALAEQNIKISDLMFAGIQKEFPGATPDTHPEYFAMVNKRIAEGPDAKAPTNKLEKQIAHVTQTIIDHIETQKKEYPEPTADDGKDLSSKLAWSRSVTKEKYRQDYPDRVKIIENMIKEVQRRPSVLPVAVRGLA